LPIDADYTREDNKLLPANDDNLSTAFTGHEYDAVKLDDGTYVGQKFNFHMLFEWKDMNPNSNNTDKIKPSCKIKSSLAPSISAMYLQVYNQTTSTWVTIATNNIADANVEFTINGSQFAEVDNFYKEDNGDYWVSCRVYQEAIY